MQHQKKVIIVAMLIVIFVLLVSISSWYVQLIIESGTVCSCAIPLPILFPIIASIGLLVGTIIYYISYPGGQKVCLDKESVLIFFSGVERDIMDTLISNKGEMSQAAIVRLTGIPKVKVFRSLEKLRMRGMIEKESRGKTNTIRLSETVSRLFQ